MPMRISAGWRASLRSNEVEQKLPNLQSAGGVSPSVRTICCCGSSRKEWHLGPGKGCDTVLSVFEVPVTVRKSRLGNSAFSMLEAPSSSSGVTYTWGEF